MSGGTIIENYFSKKNKYLLENDPIKWETRIHYFYMWSFLIANVFLVVLGALFNPKVEKNINSIHVFIEISTGFTYFVAHIVLFFYAFYQHALPSKPIFYTPTQFFKRFLLFFGTIGFIFFNGFVFISSGILTYFAFNISLGSHKIIQFLGENFFQAVVFGYLYVIVMLICRELNFRNILISFIVIFCVYLLKIFIIGESDLFFASIFDWFFVGITLFLAFNYRQTSKTLILIVFNILFLETYILYWIFFDGFYKASVAVIFFIHIFLLMLLAFTLNQMSAFPKQIVSFSLNFHIIFLWLSNIKNFLINPPFLEQINHYLVVKNPAFWETKIHYVFYYTVILGNILIFLLQNLLRQTDIIQINMILNYDWLLASIFYVAHQFYFSNHINYYTLHQIVWRFVGMLMVSLCFFSNWLVNMQHYHIFLSELNSETYMRMNIIFASTLFFMIAKYNSFYTLLVSSLCAIFIIIVMINNPMVSLAVLLVIFILFFLNAYQNFLPYQNMLVIIKNLTVVVILTNFIIIQNRLSQLPLWALSCITTVFIFVFFVLYVYQNKAKYTPEGYVFHIFEDQN